jgi:hypothetical protein
MKLRVLVLALLVVAVGLMLVPAVVGWHAGASVDALGWANYVLLGAKLGLGGVGLVCFFGSRDKQEDAT